MFGGMFGPGLEMETALGTGLFISTFGVWWMVQRWEKAKRRWWKDWERIGEGLERDLQVSLSRKYLYGGTEDYPLKIGLAKAVDEKVTVVPMQACEGLHRLAEARRDEIEALKEELASLEEEAHGTPAKPT